MFRYYISIGLFRDFRHVTGLACESGNNIRKTSTATESAVRQEDPLLATAKPFEDMPNLPSLPIIGTAWMYLPVVGRYNIERNHEADRDKRKIYGDIMREKLGSVNAVISFRPEDLETMVRHEGQYPFRPELRALIAYRESRKQWYKTTGLLLLNGREWYDLRSKTQKHLLKPKAILAYLDPMQDVARDFIKRIRECRDDDKEVPNFLAELYKWALESVAFVGLDTRLGCLDKNLAPDSDGLKMIESVQTLLHLMLQLEIFPLWKYISTPMWKKFTKAADDFSEIAFKYINRAVYILEKNKDEDKELTLLQALLMTPKGLEASGAMVTVADMLAAGIDTTSHSVGFLLYNLAKHPEKQHQVYQDITSLLPNKDAKITREIYSELHYLKCCMKESFRLFPITRGTARTFDHDVAISGYRVPAGTLFISIVQGICNDEKYFKNANQFLPERWLNRNDKISHPYAYAPFGVGTRSCIGRRLAELEIICIITEIIKNFKVEYHHKDLGMYTRLVNYPDKPLRFSFIER